MKNLFISCLLVALSFTSDGQTKDTLSILKSKALSYTAHELLRPKTYSSISWSPIFNTSTGFVLINVFRSKTIGGKLTKSAYTFTFDNNMELISVNTDSINKQIKDAKVQIEQSKQQIKRNNETRDRKIEALTDSLKNKSN